MSHMFVMRQTLENPTQAYAIYDPCELVVKQILSIESEEITSYPPQNEVAKEIGPVDSYLP